ncbi:uncharacterized protein LOC128869751 [Anastrepha ludens]|uniref:uncharacterized protein LOC128869751 n=1 Tax=Anastrepha ludens TaxID=28586 RepID=UPI0023B0C25D|nr:uncharacterized protein LOC128869751 [Anastrepha ludens]
MRSGMVDDADLLWDARSSSCQFSHYVETQGQGTRELTSAIIVLKMLIAHLTFPMLRQRWEGQFLRKELQMIMKSILEIDTNPEIGDLEKVTFGLARSRVEQIDDSTFSTVNDNAPTRIVGNCSNWPDIIIASAGLINSTTWRPMLSLASDHLPIIISIEKPADFVSADYQSYINFNKPDWTRFAELTEDIFTALPIPTDVRAGERAFRKVITAAAARFVPAGRIREIRPNFPAEAAADPGDPRIKDLNSKIRQLVTQYKPTKWEEHLQFCNFTSGVSKPWSTLSSLPSPMKHNDKMDITFNGCTSTINHTKPS